MEIQLINYDSINLTEEIIGVIEFGNVTIATQGLSPEEVYTKTETDALLLEKSNTNHNHNLNDLTEKSYNSLTDKPELFDGLYNSLSDVPTEFVPSAHNHSITNVTDLQTELDSKQSVLVSGVNLKTINNISLLGSENIEISGGGGGTTDHSQLTNRDIADQHTISSITGLQTALNDKADSDSVYDISTINTLLSTKSGTSHNHSLNNLTEKSYSSLTDKPSLFSGSYNDLTNIPTEFNPSAHNQAISTITGLQTALDGKANTADIPTNFDNLYYRENEIDTKLSAKSDTTHNHALSNLTEKSYNSLTDKPTLFSGSYADLSNKPTEFTPSTHNQAISTITDLQTALDGKQATLVSGTNIKTLNGMSLLGSENIAISGGGGGETVNIETLTANKTLTASDATIQIYTSTANRTIDLPTAGVTVGQKFVIRNNSTTQRFTIRANSSQIDIVSGYGISKEFRWDGTSWGRLYTTAVSIGEGAYLSGNYAVSVGQGSFSGTSAVSIGRNAGTGSEESTSVGGDSKADAYNVAIGGSSNTNYMGMGTVALGYASKAERPMELVSTASWANKAQLTIQKFMEKDLATNSAAFQELFIDGSSARLTIIASSVYHFRIQINAIDKTNFDVKTWDVVGAIKRDASNVTSLVSAVTKTVTSASAGASAWDVQVTANDTNEALKIEVKHNSANQVRFSLNIFATETRI